MSLSNFFSPRSIAIVGVSHNPKKVGYLVAKNILDQGYQGQLYFVHPEAQKILAHQTYPTLQSIAKKIDLVILCLPAEGAIQILDQVKIIGCKNVLLYAAGFKENNDEIGRANEQALIKKIRDYNLTLLGPNCLGFINTHAGINATFLKSASPKGNIGFISQSGALGSVMVDYFAAHENLGFSYFISLGNKTALDESDMLEYLTQDKSTEVIGMYLEGVTQGDRFRAALHKAAQQKPVIILKSGTTQAGSQAALSHTGGMVGDDQAFEAICQQTGAIRVHTFSELITLLKMTSFHQVPDLENILVLSNAGGVGVLLADQLIQEGLQLVTISAQTKDELLKAFAGHKKITIHNPIDLLGDASAFDYQKAITETSAEQKIGAVIVLLTTQANTEIKETAKVLIANKNKFGNIPVYPVFMGEQSVAAVHQLFEQNRMASFYHYDVLPTALKKLLTLKNQGKTGQKHPSIYSLSSNHAADIQFTLLANHGNPFLSQLDSLTTLKHAGIAIVPVFLAQNEDDLAKIVNQTKFPVVAKVASSQITHKTEVKGVYTHINSIEELQRAYHALGRLSGNNACYVQQQATGHEIIFGAKRDATFGTIVMVGMGGIYAEMLKETIQAVYPFTYGYFETQLFNSKLRHLLEGFRRTQPVDAMSLYQIANSLGQLMTTFNEISEIDINPAMVNGVDCQVVDARIILTKS